MTTSAEPSVLDLLRDAINSGDPGRVADCFTDDYRAELPHHPERSFTGNEQVRNNWTMIFAGISDLRGPSRNACWLSGARPVRQSPRGRACSARKAVGERPWWRWNAAAKWLGLR
ncbi:nuclear transport factor 2 family protein [Mycolicibacterium sp. P1-18]|nr:nuclear transport factor 2 family protein [Mycolicibacterium sp. P1-18]